MLRNMSQMAGHPEMGTHAASQAQLEAARRLARRSRLLIGVAVAMLVGLWLVRSSTMLGPLIPWSILLALPLATLVAAGRLAMVRRGFGARDWIARQAGSRLSTRWTQRGALLLVIVALALLIRDRMAFLAMPDALVMPGADLHVLASAALLGLLTYLAITLVRSIWHEFRHDAAGVIGPVEAEAVAMDIAGRRIWRAYLIVLAGFVLGLGVLQAAVWFVEPAVPPLVVEISHET